MAPVSLVLVDAPLRGGALTSTVIGAITWLTSLRCDQRQCRLLALFRFWPQFWNSAKAFVLLRLVPEQCPLARARIAFLRAVGVVPFLKKAL